MSILSIKPKALMCWSGGKDSSMALQRASSDYEITGLLTTLNADFKRISMHGVREELLDAQAQAIGLPIIKVWVSAGSNAEYEQQMRQALQAAKADGVTHVIFGDIFLQDLRDYREKQLAKVGLQAVFPLWQRDTTALIREFIASGFNTITCCINDGYLDAGWAGREINQLFIDELPASVDPCGENGEYHTFCYAGPIFKSPVLFKVGEVVYRPLDIPMQVTSAQQADDTQSEQYMCSSPVQTKGFWFCELLPA